MQIQLYPPLERLRRELFSSADSPRPAVPPETMAELPLPSDDAQSPLPMPAFIHEHIIRTVAAQRAHPTSPPAVGQIRALSAINSLDNHTLRTLGRNVAVLLGSHLAGQQWQGWLVTADTDYASDQDLLIEEEDGAADPQAGMIMTHLPLRVSLKGDEPIFAQISPARLGAVIALAEAAVGSTPFSARPGHIFARDIDQDHVGITGSPLGSPDDPRHTYQALHRQLAEEITAAAELKVCETQKKPERNSLFNWLFGRHWAPAPVLVALLALFVGQHLWLNIQDDGIERYRGLNGITSPCETTARLRVAFKSSAQQEAIVRLLRKAEARVVNGPSETGEWWLSLPTDTSPQETLALFRNSPLVADAILIAPKDASCQP